MSDNGYKDLETAVGSLTSNSLRRADDIERVSKLEYIVADHHIAIQALEREVSTIREGQQQIINNLKTIKHTLIGGILGALLITGSLEKAISVLFKMIVM